MSKDKLEKGAMLNPKCQECTKKDSCNNKTLCAYLIPKTEEQINNDKNYNEVIIDNINKALADIKITPEMMQEQIHKKIVIGSLELIIGIDFGNCVNQKDKSMALI